jgi:hypothetical protein
VRETNGDGKLTQLTLGKEIQVAYLKASVSSIAERDFSSIEVFPFHSEAISEHEFLSFPATPVQIPDHVLRYQPSACGEVNKKSFHLSCSH